MDMEIILSLSNQRRCLFCFPFVLLLSSSCTCGDDEPRQDQYDGGRPTVEGSAPEDLEQIRSRVQRLIRQERYDEAIVAAERASDPELEPLIEEATEERRARAMLQEACTEIDGKNLAAVHEACRDIVETSRYYQKGCCSGAAERYGENRLQAALDQAEIEGIEPATRSALALAQDLSIPEYLRDQAEALADDLANLPDSEVDGSISGSRGAGGRWGRQGRGRSKSGGGRDENLSLAQESFASNAIRQARDALSHGNAQGCISALRGAPQSDGVISLLITCYVRAGDMGSACQLANRNPDVEYAQRFRATRCR